jgi:hypothetical protein
VALALLVASGVSPAVAGCSPSSHSYLDTGSTVTVLLPAEATPPDPCSLLTTDEVSATLGQQVSDGSGRGPLKFYGQRLCSWKGDSGTVTLMVATDAGVAAASQQGNGRQDGTVEAIYEGLGSNHKATFDNVSDIGDRAKMIKTGTSPSLLVLVGHTLLQLDFTNPPSGGADRLVPLAGNAVRALPASVTPTTGG